MLLRRRTAEPSLALGDEGALAPRGGRARARAADVPGVLAGRRRHRQRHGAHRLRRARWCRMRSEGCSGRTRGSSPRPLLAGGGALVLCDLGSRVGVPLAAHGAAGRARSRRSWGGPCSSCSCEDGPERWRDSSRSSLPPATGGLTLGPPDGRKIRYAVLGVPKGADEATIKKTLPEARQDAAPRQARRRLQGGGALQDGEPRIRGPSDAKKREASMTSSARRGCARGSTPTRSGPTRSGRHSQGGGGAAGGVPRRGAARGPVRRCRRARGRLHRHLRRHVRPRGGRAAGPSRGSDLQTSVTIDFAARGPGDDGGAAPPAAGGDGERAHPSRGGRREPRAHRRARRPLPKRGAARRPAARHPRRAPPASSGARGTTCTSTCPSASSRPSEDPRSGSRRSTVGVAQGRPGHPDGARPRACGAKGSPARGTRATSTSTTRSTSRPHDAQSSTRPSAPSRRCRRKIPRAAIVL